jgi:hypothetical protein
MPTGEFGPSLDVCRICPRQSRPNGFFRSQEMSAEDLSDAIMYFEDDDDWIVPDVLDIDHQVKYVKDGATVYDASDNVDSVTFLPSELDAMAESVKGMSKAAAPGHIKVFLFIHISPDRFKFSPMEVVFHKDGNDVICKEFQDKDVYICKINSGPDTTTLLATADRTVPACVLRKLCPDGDISLHCMSRGKISAIDFDEVCGIQASAPPSPVSVLTAFVTS